MDQDYVPIKQIEENIWEIPQEGKMRVPARIFASKTLLNKIQQDKTLTQLRNATQLPGIQRYAIALPDAHQGYGFPVGGVAAIDAENGVISPGAIGYDINCGVRVCKTNLLYKDLQGHEEELVNLLFESIPTGIGRGGIAGTISESDLDEVSKIGVRWAVDNGHGVEEDLLNCEDEGFRPGADPIAVSNDAKSRGRGQLGSLGSGNHFLEVQRVTEIFDSEIADQYGLVKDQVVFTIHCGSRGFGHQICTDYLRRVEREHRDLMKQLPDKELACAPASSGAGRDYYKAMNCAINFAWCNRQLIMHETRKCFENIFNETWQNLGMDLLYDVAHNIGKKEIHKINGSESEVYVHRKGATRAFPPGRQELPRAYRDVGQPVIIPGSMGTGTYVLRGTQTALDLTFGSTAHGAGRLFSRTKAKKQWRADDVTQELKAKGIFVRGRSKATIAEEAPGAYKDIDEVIRVSHEIGIGSKVAMMMPVCNIKG
jgi:tRNA-splicing ligase RtcB